MTYKNNYLQIQSLPYIKYSNTNNNYQTKNHLIPQYSNISTLSIPQNSQISSKNNLNKQIAKSSTSNGYPSKSYRQYFQKSELRVIKSLKNKKTHSKYSQNNLISQSKVIVKESLYWEKIKKHQSFNLTTKFGLSCRVQQIKSFGLCTCDQPCKWAKNWTYQTKIQDCEYFTKILKLPIKKKIFNQIEIDIPRTQPFSPGFEDVKVKKMLKDVLVAYSNYDPKTGYVQGMNMIASILIYHIKNTQKCFYVFVDLMQKQRFCQIYENDKLDERIQGHYKNVMRLIEFKINDLFLHFEEVEVNIKTPMIGWFFSMLCNTVPLEDGHLVIDSFFKNGWNGIYKIIVDLMMEYDETQILSKLSISYVISNKIQWKQIIQSIDNIIIDGLLI